MGKWIVVLAVVALTVCLGACAPAPEPAAEAVQEPMADPAADQAAIAAVGQMMRDGIAAGNADAILATYTDDAIVMSPNRPAFRGQEAIRSFLERMLGAFTSVEWISTSEEIMVGGDYGYELVSLDIIGAIEGGESLIEQAMQVRIYQRQEDGSWKIARDIWSLSGTGETPE